MARGLNARHLAWLVGVRSERLVGFEAGNIDLRPWELSSLEHEMRR